MIDWHERARTDRAEIDRLREAYDSLAETDNDLIGRLRAVNDRAVGAVGEWMGKAQRLAAVNAELAEALLDLADRADRARGILRKPPIELNNWGMLDTTLARAALAAAGERELT